MGTPLTEEELKSIVGGNMDTTRTCTCTLHFDGKPDTTSTTEANSEAICKGACNEMCRQNGECLSAEFSYGASGSTASSD